MAEELVSGVLYSRQYPIDPNRGTSETVKQIWLDAPYHLTVHFAKTPFNGNHEIIVLRCNRLPTKQVPTSFRATAKPITDQQNVQVSKSWADACATLCFTREQYLNARKTLEQTSLDSPSVLNMVVPDSFIEEVRKQKTVEACQQRQRKTLALCRAMEKEKSHPAFQKDGEWVAVSEAGEVLAWGPKQNEIRKVASDVVDGWFKIYKVGSTTEEDNEEMLW